MNNLAMVLAVVSVWACACGLALLWWVGAHPTRHKHARATCAGCETQYQRGLFAGWNKGYTDGWVVASNEAAIATWKAPASVTQRQEMANLYGAVLGKAPGGMAPGEPVVTNAPRRPWDPLPEDLAELMGAWDEAVADLSTWDDAPPPHRGPAGTGLAFAQAYPGLTADEVAQVQRGAPRVIGTMSPSAPYGPIGLTW